MINSIFAVAGTFLAWNEKMGSLMGYNCGYDTMLYLKKKLIFEKKTKRRKLKTVTRNIIIRSSVDFWSPPGGVAKFAKSTSSLRISFLIMCSAVILILINWQVLFVMLILNIRRIFLSMFHINIFPEYLIQDLPLFQGLLWYLKRTKIYIMKFCYFVIVYIIDLYVFYYIFQKYFYF